LQAITTGSVPGFFDIAANLDSPALVSDSLILQLAKAGKRLELYGDDTWLKLFPDSFQATDGTSSFFVADYTEVDDNVTRHGVQCACEPLLTRCAY
jgi:ethanolaminephosphotransferase